MNDMGNRAYDLSLFEAAPELERNSKPQKKNNLVRLPNEDKEQVKVRKHNPLYIAMVSVCVAIFTVIAVTIIQGNVLLNELNSEIMEKQDEIDIYNGKSAQYQVKIDSMLSDEKVEAYAEGVLGMTKANSLHKEFVTMSSSDSAQVLGTESEKNIFETVADAFTGLWS